MNVTFAAPNVTVDDCHQRALRADLDDEHHCHRQEHGAGSADNRTIVIGSHLDSVPAGPGINDNGSGSMSNLAVALAAASLNLTYSTRVRHCWWGAEELGLLGSTAYVKSLPKEELDNILLNLNFDMLGSPNGVLYIDKINPNSTTVPEPVKVASLHIEDLFQMFFETVINKPWVPTTIDNPGRSDYAAFLAANIPAGGLATGAEELKTVAQQAVFGGLQGAQLDPCYHQACDTIDNIDWTYLFDNVRALAFTVQHLGSAGERDGVAVLERHAAQRDDSRTPRRSTSPTCARSRTCSLRIIAATTTMSEHLFPLSERAQTLLAKFRTFIEQEDFDAVEKRIVADYAERSGRERWSLGMCVECALTLSYHFSFVCIVLTRELASGNRAAQGEGSSGAAVESVDSGRFAARRASHQCGICVFRGNHGSLVDGGESKWSKCQRWLFALNLSCRCG
jgi:hypothetical protein